MVKFYKSFKDMPVEPEKLKALEEASLYAPYGLNPPQPWKVVVVKSKEKVGELVKLHKIHSPVIFLFFTVKGIMMPNHLTNLASGVAQAVNVAFQCQEVGLGCFIDPQPSYEFVNKAFEISGVDRNRFALSAVAFIGYPGKELEGGKVDFEIVERR